VTRRWRRFGAVWALATLGGFCACNRPAALPEHGSYAARLYVERCGGCHAAYNPRSMTAGMWQVQVQAMEPRMAQAGLPLSDAERRTILRYLTRNAGG
jgi:Dihaem cytochrome c